MAVEIIRSPADLSYRKHDLPKKESFVYIMISSLLITCVIFRGHDPAVGDLDHQQALQGNRDYQLE